MSRGISKIVFILSVSLLGFSFALKTHAEGNPRTKAGCETFLKKLPDTVPGVRIGEIELPLDPSDPNSERLPVKFWVRGALEGSSALPLVLVHGGVGGSSEAFLSWRAIIEGYPGPVVSLDLRGEGCSNFFGYDCPPEFYKVVSIERTVQDLEFLRRHLFGDQPWHFFGQSRGAGIGYRYLEMASEGLASATVHGLAPYPLEEAPLASLHRSRFAVRAANRFFELHPEAREATLLLRQWLEETNACFSLNYALLDAAEGERPQVCGPHLIDAISGRIGGRANWQKVAADLAGIVRDQQVNPEAARQLVQGLLDSSLYVRFMSYILGSNALEFGAPNFEVLARLEEDPELRSALVSEGRFIHRVMFPIHHARHGRSEAHFHPTDFQGIANTLNRRREMGNPLPFRVYFGDFDAVAGPRAFSHLTEAFGGESLVKVLGIEDSGHDGWRVKPDVANWLLEIGSSQSLVGQRNQ